MQEGLKILNRMNYTSGKETFNSLFFKFSVQKFLMNTLTAKLVYVSSSKYYKRPKLVREC